MSEKDPAQGEEARDEEIEKMGGTDLSEDNAQSAPREDDEDPAPPSVGDAFRGGS